MPISSPGVGSGLDVKAIVDALVAADIAPAKSRLDRLQTGYLTELSAVGQIKGALSKLQSSMTKLSDLQQFLAKKATISNTEAFTASLTEAAALGNYQVEVNKLAASQTLASSPFPSANTTVGNGTMTITLGAYNNDLTSFTANPDKQPLVITINPGQDSLAAIRDAINNSGDDVHAAIVSDDQGARLTLTSGNTGKDFAMKITVADNDGNNTDNAGLSALSFDPVAGNSNLIQTTAAQNSEIKINGLTLTESDNQYANAIAGVTLDLKKASPGSVINLSIANNKEQVSGLISEFVKQFNDSMSVLTSLTGFDKVSKKGAVLQGDASVRNLKFNINQWLSEMVKVDGSVVRSLADIGVKTDSNGLLSIDMDALNAAIDTNFDDIGTLFAETDNTQGIAVKLHDLIDSYLNDKGSLTDRSNELNRSLTKIGDQRLDLQSRADSLQDRYLRQFSRLDSLLSSLQSTSNFLTQQLENLPQLTLKKR